jgi:hypothetical protein
MVQPLEFRFVRVNTLASDADTTEFRVFAVGDLNSRPYDNPFTSHMYAKDVARLLARHCLDSPHTDAPETIFLYRSIDNKVKNEYGDRIKPHLGVCKKSAVVFGVTGNDDDLLAIQKAYVQEIRARMQKE